MKAAASTIKPPTPSPQKAPAPSPSSFLRSSSTPPSSSSRSSIHNVTVSAHRQSPDSPQPSNLPVDFTPPLIAMVVVVAAAFLLVTYSRPISRHLTSPLIRRFRRWRHRRNRLIQLSSSSDLGSSPPYPFDSFHYSSFSPYGLDESVIKTIPLSLYSALIDKTAINSRDCAVCLLEFEEGDSVRTLPFCSHAFHVDCIDAWLRSHANCPLCRAGIFGVVPSSQSSPPHPFVPLMASRIRPSFDEEESMIIRSIIESSSTSSLSPSPLLVPDTATDHEITREEISSPWRAVVININSDDRFVLKRSYSFGFASERMTNATDPATASPWRCRRGGTGGGAFWNKRMSPFGSLMNKPRVFSSRYYKGMKSPFFRRRSLGSSGGGGGGLFFPLSERYPGGCSRRSKSMTSPMFYRPSSSTVGFSSSRLRCGDPEALLSPERYSRR